MIGALLAWIPLLIPVALFLFGLSLFCLGERRCRGRVRHFDAAFWIGLVFLILGGIGCGYLSLWGHVWGLW